jgi:hypothetical protein
MDLDNRSVAMTYGTEKAVPLKRTTIWEIRTEKEDRSPIRHALAKLVKAGVPYQHMQPSCREHPEPRQDHPSNSSVRASNFIA